MLRRALGAVRRVRRQQTRGLSARLGSCVATCALVLLCGRGALAFSSGIAGTVFQTTGCPLCHAGGEEPVVLLDGPSSLQPSETATYTFTVFGNPTQRFAGLNVSASAGTLAVGGPFSSQTKTVVGLLARDEITHSAPKQGDFLNVVEFSFLLTAPDGATTLTLQAWGNAVNGDATTFGDAATMATISVAVSGPSAGTPTPTSTPLPTATPVLCAEVAPPQPVLATDPDAAACQTALAKLGAVYVKKDLRAVQKCLRTYQAAGLGGDADARCVGTTTLPPADTATAEAIATAQNKVRKVLAAKCPDAVLGGLGACATTELGLEACFIEDHRAAVIAAVAAQYGVLTPNANRDVQKCQAALAKAAGKYLTTHLSASEKCLIRRLKDGQSVGGAAACIGAVNAGLWTPPSDSRTAKKIAKAETKLSKLLASACGAGELAPLDACGDDPAEALACLLCTHRSATYAALGSELGGAP